MPKARYKIRNWKKDKQNKRRRPSIFSELAITAALMVKRIFQYYFVLHKGLFILYFDWLRFHSAAHSTVVSVVGPKTLM